MAGGCGAAEAVVPYNLAQDHEIHETAEARIKSLLGADD